MATETVTVTPEPEPVVSEVGTAEDPMVVELSHDDRALLGLVSAIVAIGVGARIVGSFGGS